MEYNLGARFGINNVIIPKSGPACVPATLDFSNAATIEIDGEQVTSQAKIEYLQGVYIDNSQNAVDLTLTMNTTGQRIIAKAKTQGYYNLLVPNPPRIKADMAQQAGRTVPLFFYNVPIQASVWAVS
jgi:hypothetical protein